VKLFSTVSNLDVDGWLRGLFSAGISGGASAITGGLAVTTMDPEHFQGSKFWLLIGILFATNAVVSMAKFLQGQPLPSVKEVTTTTAITAQGSKPPVITTTTSETHVEPISSSKQ
jgi:hypothetical protein